MWFYAILCFDVYHLKTHTQMTATHFSADLLVTKQGQRVMLTGQRPRQQRGEWETVGVGSLQLDSIRPEQERVPEGGASQERGCLANSRPLSIIFGISEKLVSLATGAYLMNGAGQQA